MFGTVKFRFPTRERLLWTPERVVFFVLNSIARWTSTRWAALFADWISNNVPRFRFIYMFVDATSQWISQETRYNFCWRCDQFVINDALPEWHRQCELDEQAEILADRALDEQLDLEWNEIQQDSYDDTYEYDDAYSASFDDEEDEDLGCTDCGEYSCQGDCERPEMCPGGCGERERNCVCPELASLRRYNATPLEERDGPWTA